MTALFHGSIVGLMRGNTPAVLVAYLKYLVHKIVKILTFFGIDKREYCRHAKLYAPSVIGALVGVALTCNRVDLVFVIW